MSIVYVNSTLRARRAMSNDGSTSPLHYWGYAPHPGDALLMHRLNRWEIHLRHRLGGLDPSILAATLWRLGRNATGTYVVSQPDLWQVFPLLKELFPRRPLATWVWMDWEVDLQFDRLRTCDHVFCLTPGAKQRLDERGMSARSSFVLWGCDPAYYRATAPVPAEADVIISGMSQRDTALARAALDTARYRVLLTPVTAQIVGRPEAATPIGNDPELRRAYHRSRVCWILLRAEDRYPSGLTNLIESLLCGTAVVIADRTLIPEPYLTLPGVFRYRTGDLTNLLARTDEALAWTREPRARSAIAAAAAERLSGQELSAAIARTLGPGHLRR
ncbi:MAG: hypothetical protein KF715_05620 [Candidatus Didemnitutus sp.]|nr:hypothetical protein [Candidatus Didemnitutus sp.]